MVSIIVPVYNTEQYITECIESLINQTYKNIEIILIDDGSTDKSGVICDEYKNKDNRIVVIHKKNGGPNSAIKLGIKRAQGELIAFADSDDWVEYDYVDVMVCAMKKYDSELVCANGYMNDEKENMMRLHAFKEKQFTKQEIIEDIYPSIFAKMDSKGYRIAWSRYSKLYSKNLLMQNLQFYDENIRLGEDSLMTIPYVLCCQKIAVIENKIYHYRNNTCSLSHTFKKKNLDDLKQCINWYKIMANQLSEYDFSSQIIARGGGDCLSSIT